MHRYANRSDLCLMDAEPSVTKRVVACPYARNDRSTSGLPRLLQEDSPAHAQPNEAWFHFTVKIRFLCDQTFYLFIDLGDDDFSPARCDRTPRLRADAIGSRNASVPGPDEAAQGVPMRCVAPRAARATRRRGRSSPLLDTGRSSPRSVP